jgi:2-methylcitrate dehydratase PrpD
VGPAQLKPDKFDDPVILDLIDKITVLPDASLHTSVTRWAGISQIRTRDGRTLQHRVDIPHGYVDDMLTDEEIEAKFRHAAGPYQSEEKIAALISAVWELDNASAIGDLMRLLVVEPSGAG